MKKNSLSMVVTGALLTATAVPLTANADIHFSGFASIVGGKTLADDESIYGYDDNFSFDQDSLVALQASSDLGEGLGVTVQLAAKGKEEWDPKFNWAYLSYDATDNLRFLAGRQRAPFYMYSDYLDVSYAYPWISPPVGVYDLIFDTFDGLGAMYNTSIGDSDLALHGIYGRNTDKISAFGKVGQLEVNNMVGLATTYTYDWLTLRASYFVAEATLEHEDTTAASAGWAAYGFSEQAENSVILEEDTSFFELGFQVNYDDIIVVGEYTNLNIENSPFAEESSYFIMAGYQYDSTLIHLTYGADENSLDDYVNGASLPAGTGESLGLTGVELATFYGTFDYLKQQTQDSITGQNIEEKYITIGVRYDFHESAALKLDYTTFTNDDDSSQDAGVLRAALVTVF